MVTAATELVLRLSEAVNLVDSLEEIYQPALDAVTQALASPRAAVLLLDHQGVMRFKAWRGLSDAYRAAVEGHSPWPPNDPDPEPIFIEDVLNDDSFSAYHDLFRAEGIRALGFVPLVHGHRLIGKFMVYFDEPRKLDLHEQSLARTIAAQASQAVVRARLREQERLARERLRRLQGVTASLSEAATPGHVARVLVAEGLLATGAATGGLWLLRNSKDVADLIHSEGYSDQGRAAFGVLDLDKAVRTPVVDVLRTDESVWLRSKAELAARYPALAAGVAPRPEYRLVCLPIRARGECLAALGFTFDFAGEFDEDEQELLLNIARQGGIALERSQLLEAESKARSDAEAAFRRAAFKADASAALASSLDYETTLKNVAKLAVPRFADWCSVELGDSEGRSALVAVEHVDPSKVELAWRLRERYPPDPHAKQGVPHVLRTGTPLLYEEITDDVLVRGARDADHLAMARSLGLRSAITVPMMIHGRTIGAITFIWAESGKRYDRADLETAALIGQRAALAIENSKLHGDLKRAVRARDDLLAVVSHDLRNPLAAISLKAEAIVRFLPDQPGSPPPRQYAEGIQSAVRRMDHLIKDLLDLGSIEAGQLKLEHTLQDLESIISSATEEMQPLASAKGLRVEVEPPAQPVRLLCDKSRILQVLSNLLGNAVKFTPSGGRILVRPSLEAGSVKVLVRDTGRGIAAEHLARIFDRYYQEPEKERRGVGLGLFIASGVVAAHGGRIWAESTLGSGSNFYFTLPLDQGQ